MSRPFVAHSKADENAMASRKHPTAAGRESGPGASGDDAGQPPAKRPRRSPIRPMQLLNPLQDQSNIMLHRAFKATSVRQKSPSLVVDESDAELMELGLHRIVDHSRDPGTVAAESPASSFGDPDGLAAANTLVDLRDGNGRATVHDELNSSGLGSEEKRLRLISHHFHRASPSPLVSQSESPEFRRPRVHRSCSTDLAAFTASPPGPNHFDRLSDEMVIQVFKWLPKATLAKVAMACRRFQVLTTDEVFWRRLDLGLKPLPQGVLGVVLHRGVSVLRVARGTVYEPIFQTSKEAGGFIYPENLLCKLQYLDLSIASISVLDLEKLLGVCNNLRKLALENLDISETVCKNIAKNSVLNTLHLGMTRGITEGGICNILKGCRQLRELNVGWTEMDIPCLSALVKNLHANVERLNLSGCRDILIDDHVETIVDKCVNLLELDLSDALNLTPEAVDTICRLERLESLSTSRCYSIIPAAYLALESSPSLRYLNVFGVLKEVALSELKKRLPKIEINKFLFTSIARPTVGIKRTSIWGLRVRD